MSIIVMHAARETDNQPYGGGGVVFSNFLIVDTNTYKRYFDCILNKLKPNILNIFIQYMLTCTQN